MQRGPAHVVDVIDFDLRSKEHADKERVAPFGSADQPGSVVAVLRVDIGPVLQRQSEEAEEPFAGGDQVRALNRRVLGIDIGAFRL